MKSCDIFVFPSLQEGLPVALMEAMACGLPCVASEIRGNVDLINEDKNGYLFNKKRENDLLNAFRKAINNKKGDLDMEQYSTKKICQQMKKIYFELESKNNES